MTTTTEPTEAHFERFLDALETTGHEKRAAEQAGITVKDVARRARRDPDWKERYLDARGARAIHVRDKLFELGIEGIERVDPTTGAVKREPHIATLHALAKQDGELQLDRPTTQVAVQTNVNGAPAAVSPEIAAAAKRNTERMNAILRRDRTKVITADVVDVTPTDPDNDII